MRLTVPVSVQVLWDIAVRRGPNRGDEHCLIPFESAFRDDIKFGGVWRHPLRLENHPDGRPFGHSDDAKFPVALTDRPGQSLGGLVIDGGRVLCYDLRA